MATSLVHLPDVQRLSPLVLRVMGGNPGKFTLQGTNTYLVGTGSQRILIDTGEGKASWSKLLSSVLISEHTTISDVLLTHWHPDHVGGVTDLLRLCPQARVHKHSASEGQIPIADGQAFTGDGTTLLAFHCPGHTTDHMAFVLEQEKAMFTGDNVLGHGTAVFEDLKTYMTSLERMKDQVSGRAYPGHGPVIDNGKKRIIEYIEHRHQRERDVLHVLAEAGKTTEAEHPTRIQDEAQHDTSGIGERTPMEIVKVIYHDVPENLHEPAARGVVQILQKLAIEDKVVRSADGHWWQIARRAMV
ncbi:MAG: hypothetical protein Q9208_001779 [Pyrenodesmia sp. 3 TL-2023]